MKVLIVGSGGREHALAWRISQSPLLSELHAAPGNPGIARHGTCHDVHPTDVDGIAALATSIEADLVIVGPEDALVAGLGNRLRRHEIPVVGPSAAAARIEGSKVYARELMDRAQVPTARWEAFSDVQAALAAINRWRGPVVIKADGLAGGRGSFVCMTKPHAEEALTSLLVDSQFGIAGRRVIVEEFLQGTEASITVLTDGENVVPLPVVASAHRVRERDHGANTDGMGAWTPVMDVFDSHVEEAVDAAIRPALADLADRGIAYSGVLYADVMFTPSGPKVLEFNCRLGELEAMLLARTLDDDLLELLAQVGRGELDASLRPAASGSAVGVTVAADSYPAREAGGKDGTAISGIDEAAAHDGVEVFYGDAIAGSSSIESVGGRPLYVTAVAPTIAEARERAHAALDEISFDGMHVRRDIAEAAIEVEALV